MTFKFSEENLKKAKLVIAKYPEGRQKSAVMDLLDLAQRQNGNWLSRDAIEYVAQMLEMAVIRVYEIATFYTMYNLKPVGKHLIQICGTTPCMLSGSEAIKRVCKKELGIDVGQSSEDGQFSLVEVECLGACVNAPVVQINDDYYEDLDEESMTHIIDALRKGHEIKTGSQKARQCSAPVKNNAN